MRQSQVRKRSSLLFEDMHRERPSNEFEQCEVVVFVADDLGFLGPGIPDLMTELCPPRDTA